MSSLWRNTSGDLIRVDGDLIRCDTCPCVPSTCPCGTWPPSPVAEDFPCGGLEYQYNISANSYTEEYWLNATCSGASDLTLSSYTQVGLRTLTAVSDSTVSPTSCRWVSDSPYDPDVILRLDPANKRWLLLYNPGQNSPLYIKNTGNSPIGTYTLSNGGCTTLSSEPGEESSFNFVGISQTVEVTDVP